MDRLTDIWIDRQTGIRMDRLQMVVQVDINRQVNEQTEQENRQQNISLINIQMVTDSYFIQIN